MNKQIESKVLKTKLCHSRRSLENRNKYLNMNHRLQAAYTFLEEIIPMLSLLLFLAFMCAVLRALSFHSLFHN